MENLRETINTGLSKAIQEDHDTEDVNILYDLVMGSTTPAFAAVDLVALANRTSGDQAFLLDISIQILSLACDYPFLQPALVDLVASLSRPSPSSPTSPTRYDFVSSFATMTGDLTRANYGHLFDAASSTSTTGLIQDHVNLNGFIARLLSTVDSPEDPKDRVTGLDDALFIMSTSLEDHPNSHSLPDVDIPAAAQYMIHAGALLLKACQDRTGRDLAADSPLWATKGKLWEGTPAFSRERWDLWKSRFRAVASDDVAQSTRRFAETAVRAMSYAEEAAPEVPSSQ